MLKISERVRPCSARCSPRSVGRLTSSVESSRSIDRSGDTCCSSSPLGPLTRTRPGSTWTSTPEGMSIGSFPILLIASSPDSPDEGDDLAAHALAAGLVGGHDATRGRDDRGAHAAQYLRKLLGRRILAAAGLGHP